MPLSNSVLRRYTPPTCTLEIVAKSSPLSRWVGQSVLKDLRFELRFDDPRKPEDQRVTIRGGRTELEVLCEAVNSYVQDFLGSSSAQLAIPFQSPINGTDSMPGTDQDGYNEPHSGSAVNHSASVTAQASEEELDKRANSSSAHGLESDSKLRTLNPPTFATEIYLQPRGLLGHDLFLGRLATEESGPAVNLSVLQLFDLATALDEYVTDVVALPNLNPPLSWRKSLPAWTPTAAAVLVTVGVTATTVKLLDRANTKQQAAAPTAGQTPILRQSPLLSQVPLAPTTPISPLPTPVLPPSIASSPKLLPPPAVTVPPPGTLTAPERQRPTLSINPANSSPAAIADSPKRPGLIPGGIASLPSPAGTSRNPSSPSSARTTASRSPSASTPAQQTKPSVANVPPAPPPLPALPSLQTTPASSDVAQSAAPSPAARTTSASGASNQSESASAGNAANSKLSDTIPQVAEARSYFEQRWKPPSGLTQTLEYSLSLNPDGSIQRILPLGKAAGDFIDRTNMPLPGEPFVSPVQGTGNPRIRLVLTPDGKVQTFLDQ